MPDYRIHGDVKIAFIHTIKAESLDEACDAVNKLRMSVLDTVDTGEIEVQGAVELDIDGNEVD